MKSQELKREGKYNWIGQSERLVYIGTKHYPSDHRAWYQFALVDKPNVCWCEVLESDLTQFEETNIPEPKNKNDELWRLGRSVGK
jgi:hypothetical protein